MLLLSPVEQQVVNELKISNLKQWLHVWLDGLHKGTHPAWALSPINIPALGKIWNAFQKKEGEPDFGKYQRLAIKKIALSRHLKNDHSTPLPNLEASNEVWSDYFNNEILNINDVKQKMISWHKHAILSNTNLNIGVIRSNAQCLSSIMNLQGFSDRELFLRVNSGVIDLHNIQQKPIDKRFLDFMEYLLQPVVKTFTCWTPVLTNQPISRTTLNKLTKTKFTSPRDLKTNKASLVILGEDESKNNIYVISNHLSSHSSTAFIQHRRQSAHLLNNLSNKIRLPLALNDKTNVIDTVKDPNKPWIYDIESIMEWKRMKFTRESILIPSASKYYHDYPELVIKDFCDKIERSMGLDWINELTAIYVLNLRKQLTFNLRVYIRRARKTWKETDLGFPMWLKTISIDPKSKYKLYHLLQSCDDTQFKNDLFISRVYQVTKGWNQNIAEKTQEEFIKSILTICKGIRNIMTHDERLLDNDLNEVLWYFLNILIYVCNNDKKEIT